MKNKRWGVAIAIVGTCVLTACSSGQSSAYMEEAAAYDSKTDDLYMNDEEYADQTIEPEGEPEVDGKVSTSQKLIKEVDLSVETKEYDKLLTNIENKVKGLGGYIESLYTSNDSYNNGIRSGDITARIPSTNLEIFVDGVAECSNVISRKEMVKDVTLQYVDLKSHKKVLEIEQERLLVLLEKAETLEAIITLEGRLTEVRYELESMESQLRAFDNQIDYSTVYVSIQEVERITPVEVREQTDWEKIKVGFTENLYHVISGVKNLAIRLIISIPILVVMAVLILIFAVIVKLGIRINNKKKQQNIQKLMNHANHMKMEMAKEEVNHETHEE